MFTTYMHAQVRTQSVTHFLGITQTHAKRAHVHALCARTYVCIYIYIYIGIYRYTYIHTVHTQDTHGRMHAS